MPLWPLSQPTHLGIFVTDPVTGQPTKNLSLYAEVAIPQIVPSPPPETRFIEHIYTALNEIDPSITAAIRTSVERAVSQALTKMIDKASLDALRTQDFNKARNVFVYIFKEVLNMAGRDHYTDIKSSDLEPLIITALKQAAKEFGLILLETPEDSSYIWADPLGVLTTDHVGYASFDLRRLRPEVRQMLTDAIEIRRNDPNSVLKIAIWVQPYGQDERFDALAQARFAFDAVVARLSIKAPVMPAALNNMGLRALQNPALTDWRLSPASFAASPKTLVGEDGCEELVPANLALQEFVLRQVVRVTDPTDDLKLPGECKFAYVDEYKVSWYQLGHSLGEILYSLPLAPGENVKLAVIDWSWDNLTKRDEKTKLTEELLHQTHRDRTITEIMRAGLKEFQHGSSFMGGTAISAGATGALGPIGAALGVTGSLGGSTATTDGSRELAAENVQRLMDTFSQASSAQREINSTVVIQARQEEKESIQTRTFTNYNHSHTLTILYYEVLRHFRVEVDWIRRRPALLIQLPERKKEFTDEDLISYRYQFEPMLLDPTLRTAFDALEKREAIKEYQEVNGIKPKESVPSGWEGDIEFGLFEIGLKTAEGLKDKTDELVMANLIIWDGQQVHRPLLQLWEKHNPTDNVNIGNRLNDTAMGWFIAVPKDYASGKVKWSHLVGFEFVLYDSDEWRLDRLAINGFHANGAIALIENSDVDYYFDTNGSSNTVTFIKRPGPHPAPIPGIPNPEQSLTQEELHQIKKLDAHFKNNIDYYNRVLLLGTEPSSIAIQMEGKGYADKVDPTPLEVMGSYVAYPLAKTETQIDETLAVDLSAALNGNDPNRRQWAQNKLDAMGEADRKKMLEHVALASTKSERLITLPTRGVFAEGKLGHCNISEEIDNTRFWKWEEHPIPFEATGINPVTPIQPQPQQIDAMPTPFPQSLVNIVNPSSAPDPSGLAAAMSLLATPDIFRDMSGRQEVSDLLKRLSDNTIEIAEAGNKAREIQTKYMNDLDRQQKEYDLGIYKAAAEVEGKKVEAEAKRAAQAQAAKAEADAKKAEADAKKAEADAAKSQSEAATYFPKKQRDAIRENAAQNLIKPNKNVELIFQMNHSITNQPLDGEFNVIVVGGQQEEFSEFNSSAGIGKVSIPLEPGEYAITISGRRTSLPRAMLSQVTIPAVGNQPAFNVNLSERISPKEILLSGTGKFSVPANAKRIVLSISAVEKDDGKVTMEVDYSREQGVEIQGGFELGAKLKDFELGKVGFTGTSIDIGTNGTKHSIPITFVYLTGGLSISQH
ncbi:hypothetical protein [Neobacillus sp. 114]|uniref:hypothetical protein n=1 Tax=Neobacillus sp. 114 TaxID=3048535 RepID=UPI0024C2CDA2|nr:hypothetical protein [Neobacillus sp. 114]